MKRILADAENGSNAVLKGVDKVAGQREVLKAFDKVLHLPVAGTSMVSASDQKVQLDLPFLGNIIELHAMDLRSKYPLLERISPKNNLGVRNAVAGYWIAVFGKHRGKQIVAGWGWENEVRADFCAETNVRPQFQRGGGGARPRMRGNFEMDWLVGFLIGYIRTLASPIVRLRMRFNFV